MKSRVILTPSAENDLRTLHRYIRKHAPRAAGKWLQGMRKAIKTLEKIPGRAHLAPETIAFSEPIRELLYGRGNRATYRILFVIRGDTVFVLHIRHGSMLPLQLEP